MTNVHADVIALAVYVVKPDRSRAILPDPAVLSPTVTVTLAL